jgi:hypothetical protein
MKLKKILSFAVSAAAAAICGAAMLAIDSGAIVVPSGYKFSTDGGVTFSDVTTLDQYIMYYGQLYNADGDLVGPSSGSITLDASDGNASLTSSQLSLLAGKALSNVTVEVVDSGYKYHVYLKNRNVNFFTGGTYSNGANFIMNAEASPTGTLKLSTGNSGYLTGHPFIVYIPGDLNGTGLFRTWLSFASVDMSDRLRLYTYDTSAGTQKEKNLKVIYSKDANYDLSLTFGDGMNAYYYTKYDKIALHLYNQTNIAAYIEQKLADLSGITVEQAAYDSTVRSYFESVKKAVIGNFFEWDPSANDWKKDESVYLTAADIDPVILSYFNDKDINGNITTTARDHIDELVRTLVASSENDKVIENALYSVFGWDINNMVAGTLKTEIIDTVTQKLVSAGATIDNYKTLTQYFLNEWATEEYRKLKTEIESVRTVLDSTNTKYSSLSAVIQDLSSIRNSLGRNPSTGAAYTLYEVTQLIKGNSARVSGLTTTSEIANAIGGSQTYYTSTTPTTTTTATYSGYNNNTETYVTGQSYATKSELTSYINSLNSTINELQNQINSLKSSSANGTYNGSLYDWIRTSSYGDVDAFITEVAELVEKKIGSGESAYDIAVRNGFTGSEKAWLNSLVGESAYEIALNNGFTGSEKAWLNSLKASDSQSGDGEEKIVYVYGQKFNSASASGEETEVIINDDDAISLTASVDSTPAVGSYGGTAYSVADTSTKSSKNPATGVAAGVLIPGAAVACVFLIKKDKRRRGRK